MEATLRRIIEMAQDALEPDEPEGEAKDCPGCGRLLCDEQDCPRCEA